MFSRFSLEMSPVPNHLTITCITVQTLVVKDDCLKNELQNACSPFCVGFSRVLAFSESSTVSEDRKGLINAAQL